MRLKDKGTERTLSIWIFIAGALAEAKWECEAYLRPSLHAV
jgi:hypothetical protein